MSRAWEPVFDELVRLRYSRLVGFATLIAGPTHADDLVQEALISTFSGSRSFPTLGHAEQYVRRAIASKSVDAHRSRSRDTRRAQLTSPRESLADHADAVAADQDLACYLAALPPRTRACVVLRFLEDLSVRDTASVLGISEGAVKRYVADGLTLLRSELRDVTFGTSQETTPVDTGLGGAR